MTITGLRQALLASVLSLATLALSGCGLLDAPPTAAFSFTISWRFVPGQVRFDASTSHDPDDAIVNYDWQFGDGSRGSGESLSHTYTQSGTFSVQLTVTDTWGKSKSASQSLSILPPYVPPSPEPSTPPAGGASSSTAAANFADPIHLDGHDSPQATQSFSSVVCVLMEYRGAERFTVWLLDRWRQPVTQLANASSPFEGRVDHLGGGSGGPYSLDIDAVGDWAITVFTAWDADRPPQTYVGCSTGQLSQYSPFFYLMPGEAAFYFDRQDIVLIDYASDEAVPLLSREVDVSGGTYLLRIQGGGCWEVSVEQKQ